MSDRRALPAGLTTSQAARVTSVSPNKVRSWCDSGLMNCFRIPSETGKRRHRRILREEVLRFIREEMQQEPKTFVENAGYSMPEDEGSSDESGQ